MSEYVIYTDSSCDLTAQMAADLQLEVLPLVVSVGGNDYRNLLDGSEISFSDFYAKVRGGEMAKTSAVNIGTFSEAFEEQLKQGKDILYIGFSSGLSATYQAGVLACEQLSELYPERKLFAVDSLAASMGQGLLVYLAVEQKRQGKSIEQVRDFVEQTRDHLCHWFTVDDLMHLKRGGRVSAAAAWFGTALAIKPVMHVDDEGHLIPVDKVRGRKASIKALLGKMEETAIDPAEQVIFISHGDCFEEANSLGEMIKEQLHVKDVILNYVGPVIGAHSGPGTIALFFVGTKK